MMSFLLPQVYIIKMVASCPLAVVQPGGLVTKEQREDSMSQHNVTQPT